MIALMATSACRAQTDALSAEARRDDELRPGVVQVQIKVVGNAFGHNCGTGISGTGFLYRPDGYLITNGHVAQLAKANDDDARKAQMSLTFPCLIKTFEKEFRRELTTEEKYKIATQMKVASALVVILDNGKSYEGEIKAYSNPINSGGKDVAIIKIDGNNLPTVPLGDSDGLNVNDHVFVIGYPGDANISNASARVATSSDGIVSAKKVQDYSDTPLIQTTAYINHGNSGGPAFDASGKVIGIATFFSGSEPGFNFLVPISTAMEFVRQAGAPPERGAFDKTWHDALDAYTNQDWTKAHSLLSDVLEMMPEQPEAARLRVLAAAHMRAQTPVDAIKKSIGIPALAGIGACVALAIGLLVWLLVRKPRASGRPAPSRLEERPSPEIASSPVEARVIEATPKQPPTSDSFGSLQASGGPLTGNRFPIPKAGLLIGRDPTKCSIVLPDDSVGREHAWVVPLDNGVAVIDRNSVNGTYVNSIDSPRINKVILRHGDRIYLGKKNTTVFTYYSA
jgi:S1-C subfamily serine protease